MDTVPEKYHSPGTLPKEYRTPRRKKAPVGECVGCDRERERGEEHHPYHDASERCESGRRSHCTCDTCW